MVQEAARLGDDLDHVAIIAHVQTVERAERTVGLARSGAKRGKIVAAEQRLCSRMHGSGIERRMHVPNTANEQGGACTAVEDAIAIGAVDGREAGVPAVWCLDGAQHDHWVWLHVEVQSVADFRRRDIAGEVELGDLCLGVDTGVGAAGNGVVVTGMSWFSLAAAVSRTS